MKRVLIWRWWGQPGSALSTRAHNLWDLMPDDLRWSWCNSRTSLAQMVKHLPTMWETQVRSLRVGKILWRRKWQPTSVLLPGKSHNNNRNKIHNVRNVLEVSANHFPHRERVISHESGPWSQGGWDCCRASEETENVEILGIFVGLRKNGIWGKVEK